MGVGGESSSVSAEDAVLLLQGMKTCKTVKIQLMSCTLCSQRSALNALQVLSCACQYCKDAVPYMTSPRRLKFWSARRPATLTYTSKATTNRELACRRSLSSHRSSAGSSKSSHVKFDAHAHSTCLRAQV
ncbi:hypothetical protein GQ600_18341 [Phytophthora cactorum]|nr:hypothetical protein GQ600_18341 [Phytophthora cactorum]